jgi:hypothetical protein
MANRSYHIFPLESWTKPVDITDDKLHKLQIHEWKNNTNQIFELIPQDSAGRMFKIYNPKYKKVMKIDGKCEKGKKVHFADESGTKD